MYRHILVLVLLLSSMMATRTASAGVVNSILLQWRAQADKCEDSDRLDDMTMVQRRDVRGGELDRPQVYAVQGDDSRCAGELRSFGSCCSCAWGSGKCVSGHEVGV